MPKDHIDRKRKKDTACSWKGNLFLVDGLPTKRTEGFFFSRQFEGGAHDLQQVSISGGELMYALDLLLFFWDEDFFFLIWQLTKKTPATKLSCWWSCRAKIRFSSQLVGDVDLKESFASFFGRLHQSATIKRARRAVPLTPNYHNLGEPFPAKKNLFSTSPILCLLPINNYSLFELAPFTFVGTPNIYFLLGTVCFIAVESLRKKSPPVIRREAEAVVRDSSGSTLPTVAACW